MKKLLLYLMLLILPAIIFAQTKTDSTSSRTRSIIKFYPLQLHGGELRFGFEIPISKRFSFDLGPGYIFAINSQELDGDYSPDARTNLYFSNGFILRTGIRFYISQKDHEGLYISPIVYYKYAYYKIKFNNYPSETVNTQMNNAQLLLGNKIKRKKMAIDFYVGIGYKNVYGTYDYHRPNFNYNGVFRANYFTVHLGFNIGYTFHK